MKNNKGLKKLISSSMQYKQLYISFVLSLVCVLVTLICLTSFTFAWFTTSESTNKNSIDAGVIAIDLFKSNDEHDSRIEINDENPLFTSEDNLGLGDELIKELVVSNHGTLSAEYNIGISVEVEGDDSQGDISELIDVFFAKVDKTSGEKDDYIYLGTLNYMSSIDKAQAYLDALEYEEELNYPFYVQDERIYIKGLLDPLNEISGSKDYDYADGNFEDYYSLRFKMADKAEAKYQNCSIKISMELVSNKKINDICTIKALSNNEDFGLVIGGGTYYKDGEHHIHLIPIPKEGYKFQKWEEDSLNDDPRDIVTDEDQTYTAIFVKASEFEEDIDDPFGDDDPE